MQIKRENGKNSEIFWTLLSDRFRTKEEAQIRVERTKTVKKWLQRYLRKKKGYKIFEVQQEWYLGKEEKKQKRRITKGEEIEGYKF